MATRNIAPRANAEGSIGIAAKRWLKGFFRSLDIANGSNSPIQTLQRNTTYAVGDVVTHGNINSKLFLLCTTAGTTASNEPFFENIVSESVISDGTVVWTAKTVTSKEELDTTVASTVSSTVPAGVVLAYAKGAVPGGWLLCDGSAVSRTTYAELFAVIGTTYGSGNGSSTFNLPNLSNRFIQGNNTVGSVKSAGIPNITGDLGTVIATNGTKGTGAITFSHTANCALSAWGSGNTWAGTFDFSAARISSIYGASSTVQPPALTMRFIIKY